MAHLATDGQMETQWTSPSNNNQWMYVDLGKKYNVNNVVIHWGKNYGKEYKLYVSNKKENWQEIFHQQQGKGKKESISFPFITCRFIKFQGIKGYPEAGFMIKEIEIFGDAKKENPVNTLTPNHSLKDGMLYLDKRWTLQNASFLEPDAAHPLDGAVLSKAGFIDDTWLPAVVPGTVLTTYVANGAVPDPFYGDQQYYVSDLFAKSSFWYRTEFSLPENFKEKTIWLNFQGINYKADVFVNGEQAGNIKGAFMRGIFNITPFIHYEKTNSLAVLIHPVDHPGVPTFQDLQSPGANGGEITQDGPTFICSAGWDWMPTIRDRNSGIWQPVFISASGPVTIKDPFVITDLPLPDITKADLTVKFNLMNSSPVQQDGKVVVQTIAINGIPENEKPRIFIDGWNIKPLEIIIE